MNRRILLQVAGPALVIGLLLFATCVVSIWYIGKLQSNVASVLSKNVHSLEAAQELEIRVRQLRFHTFRYLVDPTPARLEAIHLDHERFEESLRSVREVAETPDEQKWVEAIESGYRRYKTEMPLSRDDLANADSRAKLAQLIESHPVAYVVEPCQQLLLLNKEAIKTTSQEINRVSSQAQLAMLFLGLAGPFSGLLVGYGVARGLSRSIYQLSVRVQSMAQCLDQDVASINIAANGDLQVLDRQLQQVVERVEEVAARVQQQQWELVRAEQLAAVGRLGASVAHEIRNPLAGIKMLVDAAVRPQKPQPLSGEDLQVIRREIARLEQTVEGLLDLARVPPPERGILDLREAVSRAATLIGTRARQQGVRVDVHTGEQPVLVSGDRGQLHTVLVNLFLNALDVMPQGGCLSVALEQTPQRQACLTITDTGSGILPEMSGRLFTPFASSKPTGTGLGLSISRSIVEQHGGHLQARNRPEGGACFTVTLPLSADARRDAPAAELAATGSS
jgi:signal transduction histidine kinase